jgi:hypothetical protein
MLFALFNRLKKGKVASLKKPGPKINAPVYLELILAKIKTFIDCMHTIESTKTESKNPHEGAAAIHQVTHVPEATSVSNYLLSPLVTFDSRFLGIGRLVREENQRSISPTKTK